MCRCILPYVLIQKCVLQLHVFCMCTAAYLHTACTIAYHRKQLGREKGCVLCTQQVISLSSIKSHPEIVLPSP